MTKFRIGIIGLRLMLFVITMALTVSGGVAFAKTSGPKPAPASGTSLSSGGAGAGDSPSKRRGGGVGCGHACPTLPRPGHTQPTCRGGHMGPNGVMVQCD
jgi:hypothetical protein